MDFPPSGNGDEAPGLVVVEIINLKLTKRGAKGQVMTSACAAHGKDNDAVKTAATLIGIGAVTASAVVASVGEFKQFTSGAQFGAWCGLVPRQHSSGGKNSLGGITKRGDTYLRSLLIQGAKSAVMTAHKRSDPISKWAAALRDRADWQKAVVALANKNTRILWAVMTKGDAFDARHVSVKLSAPTPASASI
jgi:transposase